MALKPESWECTCLVLLLLIYNASSARFVLSQQGLPACFSVVFHHVRPYCEGWPLCCPLLVLASATIFAKDGLCAPT